MAGRPPDPSMAASPRTFDRMDRSTIRNEPRRKDEMSATISRPTTGRKSAAPFGAVAILAGVVAIGAIAIAYGQTIKAVPVAGTPIEVQTALIQHRADERASLEATRDPRLVVAGSELQDRFPAYVAADPRLLVNQAELADRIGAAAAPVNPGVIMAQNATPTFPGKVADDRVFGSGALAVGTAHDEALAAIRFQNLSLVEQEALLASRYSSAPSTGTSLSLADEEALYAARYNSAPSYVATQPLSLVESEALLADRYGTSFNVVAFLDAEKAAADRFAHVTADTGTGTGPQTAAQKGLGPDRWQIMAQDKFAQQQSRVPHVIGPARHPVAR